MSGICSVGIIYKISNSTSYFLPRAPFSAKQGKGPDLYKAEVIAVPRKRVFPVDPKDRETVKKATKYKKRQDAELRKEINKRVLGIVCP